LDRAPPRRPGRQRRRDDLGAAVIEAAKTLAPTIDFRVGDAESLEFEDESFDGVTSTFGIMFSAPRRRRERADTRVQERRQDRAGDVAAGWHRRGLFQRDETLLGVTP